MSDSLHFLIKIANDPGLIRIAIKVNASDFDIFSDEKDKIKEMLPDYIKDLGVVVEVDQIFSMIDLTTGLGVDYSGDNGPDHNFQFDESNPGIFSSIRKCNKCGCSEINFTSECPGYYISDENMALILQKKLDYKDNHWVDSFCEKVIINEK